MVDMDLTWQDRLERAEHDLAADLRQAKENSDRFFIGVRDETRDEKPYTHAVEFGQREDGYVADHVKQDGQDMVLGRIEWSVGVPVHRDRIDRPAKDDRSAGETLFYTALERFTESDVVCGPHAFDTEQELNAYYDRWVDDDRTRHTRFVL